MIRDQQTIFSAGEYLVYKKLDLNQKLTRKREISLKNMTGVSALFKTIFSKNRKTFSFEASNSS